jgi:hypothetical protein
VWILSLYSIASGALWAIRKSLEEHGRDGGAARDAAPVLMLLARLAMAQGSGSLAPVSMNKPAIGSCAMRRSRKFSRMRWRRASS